MELGQFIYYDKRKKFTKKFYKKCGQELVSGLFCVHKEFRATSIQKINFKIS